MSPLTLISDVYKRQVQHGAVPAIDHLDRILMNKIHAQNQHQNRQQDVGNQNKGQKTFDQFVAKRLAF